MIDPPVSASTQDGVETHVFAHLGALFLVIHKQLSISEVLALFFGLSGQNEPAHGGTGEFAATSTAFANPGGRFFAEGFDDFVFEGDEKLAMAGVALSGATARELAIDPARFVAFGADDVQAADLGDSFGEFDVGTAAGHVGGDHHLSFLTRLRDDLGFDFVVFGVQNLMFDAGLG